MDEQTRKLLEECCLGCKMAEESFGQIKEFVRDSGLQEVIGQYSLKHSQLKDEAITMLKDGGYEEKSPGVMASTFSWFTTEVKLTVNSDNTQIAKLLMDGCNMGIKSLGEKLNQYSGAEKKAADLAQKIIHTEEALMKKLQKFL